MVTLQKCHLRTLLKISNCQRDSHFLRHIGQRTGQNGTKYGRGWKKKEADEKKLGARSLLLRPFGFTTLVGGTSFAGCAIWQYESLRNIARQMGFRKRSDNNQFVGKAGTFRDQVNYYGNSLSSGKKVLLSIIGINVAVFLAWRVPAFKNVMGTYFASSPFGKAPCWSMFFSNWSHYSLAHIFVNMYVLWSFSGVIDQLGKEQSIAFYSTAGVVSALTSYVAKITRKSITPSVGASGAVMAIIGITSVLYPESRMSVAFVDQMVPHSFSIGSAVLGLICFDALGLLLGWRFLDHAGHLGGMMFGIWYGTYGRKWIWEKREGFLRMWHGIRGKP